MYKNLVANWWRTSQKGNKARLGHRITTPCPSFLSNVSTKAPGSTPSRVRGRFRLTLSSVAGEWLSLVFFPWLPGSRRCPAVLALWFCLWVVSVPWAVGPPTWGPASGSVPLPPLFLLLFCLSKVCFQGQRQGSASSNNSRDS